MRRKMWKTLLSTAMVASMVFSMSVFAEESTEAGIEITPEIIETLELPTIDVLGDGDASVLEDLDMEFGALGDAEIKDIDLDTAVSMIEAAEDDEDIEARLAGGVTVEYSAIGTKFSLPGNVLYNWENRKDDTFDYHINVLENGAGVVVGFYAADLLSSVRQQYPSATGAQVDSLITESQFMAQLLGVSASQMSAVKSNGVTYYCVMVSDGSLAVATIQNGYLQGFRFACEYGLDYFPEIDEIMYSITYKHNR